MQQLKRLLLGIFVSFLFLPMFSFAQGTVEEILAYDSKAILYDDGTMEVTEKITYDFGDNQKHGIYRIIPMVYGQRTGSPRQSIDNISVTDEVGTKYKYDKSGFNTLTIKIGDDNKLISGQKTYIIKYKVKRVINSLTDKDIFNWNFIGDGWSVPIRQAKVEIILPRNFNYSELTVECFTGTFGSLTECSSNSFGEGAESTSQLTFGQDSITANNAMTVKIDFPGKTFDSPNLIEKIIWDTPWYLIFPIATVTGFFVVWFRRGRDEEGRGTIIPQYEAPLEIEPVEAGYLMDDIANNKHFSAQLIFLATKGLIRIKKIEEDGFIFKDVDYELERLESSQAVKSYNKTLLGRMFLSAQSIKISDLKNKFASDYQLVKREIYKDIMSLGYYRKSPVFIWLKYGAISLAILGIGILLALWLYTNIFGWICFVSPGIIAFAFTVFMPAKTKKGTEMKEYLLGLKEYIRVAESERIKFHNAPAKNPAKFEELLPYAMIFGLEREWAQQFEDIYKNPPDWYSGNMTTFSAVTLVSDLNSFSSTTASTFTSVSSGGGGGFSGGGGGGGGGGSW